MTTFYTLVAAALLFLNASSLTSQAYQSPAQGGSDRLVRLGLPPGIDPADVLPPGWRSKLDSKTIASLDEMTAALKKYVSDHNLNTPLPTTLTLDDLVNAKYLKAIPPAPAGKVFAISRTFAVVVVIDK